MVRGITVRSVGKTTVRPPACTTIGSGWGVGARGGGKWAIPLDWVAVWIFVKILDYFEWRSGGPVLMRLGTYRVPVVPKEKAN